MLTRRPYSTDLSDEKWEILRQLVPEAKSPLVDRELIKLGRYSTPSSSTW